MLRRLLAQNTTACQEPSVENPGSGEGASPLRLGFRNADQFGFGDGGNSADGFDHRRSHLAVKPHQGDGFDAALARAPPQRKRGDVDALVAKNGSDLTNDTGLVAVAEIEKRAFERGFQPNAVNVHNARRSAMQHRTLDRYRARARQVGSAQRRAPHG